jgi:hypothetical protein
MQKKKMGRPPKPKDQAKGRLFAARFTPAEASEIDRAIAHSGLSKSNWTRKALTNAAKSDIP